MADRMGAPAGSFQPLATTCGTCVPRVRPRRVRGLGVRARLCLHTRWNDRVGARRGCPVAAGVDRRPRGCAARRTLRTGSRAADRARHRSRLDRTTATFAREGEWGGHFYLVNTRSLEVSAAGQRIRTLHPGDGFGEIALLRDGQRTATVTALEATEPYELDRDPFLEALTGSRRALQAAAALVLERLEGDRARTVS